MLRHATHSQPTGWDAYRLWSAMFLRHRVPRSQVTKQLVARDPQISAPDGLGGSQLGRGYGRENIECKVRFALGTLRRILIYYHVDDRMISACAEAE